MTGCGVSMEVSVQVMAAQEHYDMYLLMLPSLCYLRVVLYIGCAAVAWLYLVGRFETPS